MARKKTLRLGVEDKLVPDGWTPAAWVEHLRMRAGQCRETAPGMAAMMIERTMAVEATIPQPAAAAGLRMDLEMGIAAHLDQPEKDLHLTMVDEQSIFS